MACAVAFGCGSPWHVGALREVVDGVAGEDDLARLPIQPGDARRVAGLRREQGAHAQPLQSQRDDLVQLLEAQRERLVTAGRLLARLAL